MNVSLELITRAMDKNTTITRFSIQRLTSMRPNIVKTFEPCKGRTADAQINVKIDILEKFFQIQVKVVQRQFVILNDNTYQNSIKWSKSETSFIVINSNIFANEVLPLIFKHSNFISFVRQLNLYNFHKVNRAYHRQNTITDEQRAAEPREFSHEKFIKNRPELLSQIQRKIGPSLKRRSSKVLSIQTNPGTDSSFNGFESSNSSTKCNSEENLFSDISGDNPTKTDIFFKAVLNSKEKNSLMSPLTMRSDSDESAIYRCEESKLTQKRLDYSFPFPRLQTPTTPDSLNESINWTPKNKYYQHNLKKEDYELTLNTSSRTNSDTKLNFKEFYSLPPENNEGIEIYNQKDGMRLVEGEVTEKIEKNKVLKEYISVFSEKAAPNKDNAENNNKLTLFTVNALLSTEKPNGNPLQRYCN
ncbi:hypothetical protein HK099_003859 [Clydaea vesicula]|uniref:HSF-type DNA-binding domain-containing protein n=1 Tax=Clydaea vesicula TaxID=447962 RepID=A0AAD5UA55_9FUNG|nr:hypothetical protein HK099_003859 [Clydaea vesicula]KAJ3397649.1 hypothetical protein HDU92_005391 [Lobulomyces angularis]